MLSNLQICLLAVNGLLALSIIILTIISIVEISPKSRKLTKKVNIKKLIEEKVEEKEEQISVDEMLENLEKTSQEEQQIEPKEEVVVKEVEVAEKVEEEAIVEEEIIVEEVENSEEVVDQKVEGKQESTIEEFADLENDDNSDDEDDEDVTLSYEKLEPEVVLAPGTVIDYKTRLEKVISNKEKLEKDLSKVQKSILKYERTERRKIRNEKMLDRRAGELTNLNLLMYSVTDIKNVDEDKKVKQEELTNHIAELKASIQDAEEYLESNKERNNHNVKMAKFLMQEKLRFKEEIVELEALIKAADEKR